MKAVAESGHRSHGPTARGGEDGMPFESAVPHGKSRGTDKNKSDGVEGEQKAEGSENLEELASDDADEEDGEPPRTNEEGGFGKMSRTFQSEKPSSVAQSQPR